MEKWHLLYCKPRQEQRAVLNLDQQLVEAFSPSLKVEKLSRGKRVVRDEAMFPGYVFARFDPQFVSVTSIRSTRGVASVIRFGDKLATVPDEWIAEIKNQSDMAEEQIISTAPEKGDKVILTDGQFKGLDAVFLQPDGEKRCLLLVELLGQSHKVGYDNIYVKPAK